MNVDELGERFERVLFILVLEEPLLVVVQEHVERSEVVDLLGNVRDALWVHPVVRRPKLCELVIAG